MTDKQSIRDELVQILAQKRMHTNESLGKQGADADAILASPVIRRIQAEVLREAAEEIDAGVSHLNPGNATELSYINCTRIDAQELRYHADRIEKGEQS